MRPDGEPAKVEAIPEDDDIRRCPEQMLLLRMITTALYELARDKGIATELARSVMRQRKEAHRWFADRSEDDEGLTFRNACDALGYNFDRLQRSILGMTAEQLRILASKSKVFERERGN